MKITRIIHGDHSEYAVIEGERIHPRCYLEKIIGSAIPETVAGFIENYLMDGERASLVRKAAAELDAYLTLSDVSLLAPVGDRPKIICVGLNYRDHVEESGAKLPEEPVIFMKPHTAIIGPNQPILYPEMTSKLDYEAELAVIVGRRCRKLSSEEARTCIFGYTCFNDITSRDLQLKDGQWIRAKSFDTFAPIGPWIVSKDEIGDPHGLRIISRVNGDETKL